MVIDVTNKLEFTVQPTDYSIYKFTFEALDYKTTIEREIEVEVFNKPKIELFEVSPEVVISSMPVTISWKVENAKKIEINNGIGEVSKDDHKTILHEKNTLYKLVAWGELSSVTKEIIVTVFPTPIIESLLVPLPDFENRIKLNPISIDSPKIDLSINIPEFNLTPPIITKPNIDLQTANPIHKNKSSIFNFSRIYEYLAGKR